MKIPRKINDKVRKFVTENLWLDSAPIWIPSKPRPGARFSDCFATVDSQIADLGGEKVFGWVIWERPKVLIEGEFHAIWKAPDGTLLDLSPRPDGERHICFAADTENIYNGFQVDNVRQALSADPLVQRLIEIHTLLYQYRNRRIARIANFVPPTTSQYDQAMLEGAVIDAELDEKYGICIG